MRPAFALFPIALALVSAMVGSSCSENPCASRFCESYTSVVYTMDFATEESDGVVQGFDLDGKTSQPRDADTCGHGDRVNLDGDEGVDSNASVLFGAINDVTEASVEELIRGSINEGRLLITLKLLGVDDLVNDDCVDLHIFPSTGEPVVGTDNYIVDHQTFTEDHEGAHMTVHCARIRDGILEAGPFEGTIFASIIRVNVDLRLHNAYIAARVTSSGVEDVVLGAAIETEQIHDILIQTNDNRVLDVGPFLVDSLADIDSDNDGQCDKLSATVLMSAKPSFLF